MRIARVSIESSPACCQSACIPVLPRHDQARRMRRLEAQAPHRRMNWLTGIPPPAESHIYVATTPPGRITRAISRTALAGSGTKLITSAIRAASNEPSANGSACASPV